MASRSIIFYFLFLFNSLVFADSGNVKIFDTSKNKAEIVILDKITSKKNTYIFNINKTYSVNKFKVLVKRCVLNNNKGSLEVLAYIQIQNDTKESNDRVFVYNGWMIANEPSLNSFEHANYDIWIKNCF